MLERLITALVGLVLFFIIMFSDKLILTLAIAVIAIIALMEAYNAYGYKKYKVFFAFSVLSCLLFAFGDFYDPDTILILLFSVLLISVILLITEYGQNNTKDVFTIIFFTLMIPFVFSTIGYIRRLPNGIFYVWLPFITSWCTDSAAYFIGNFFGRNKLCEKISPKKTIEGALGGIFGSVIGCLIFAAIMTFSFKQSVNYFNLIILALLASILSQLGDLFASCIKRENNIKDFGNIMPGHGGILDRFDSLLLTIPFVYIFIRIFPII